MTNTATTVPFHGTNLFIVDHNGQPYAPMKPIIDGMGMDWTSQFTKLKQRFKTSVVKITMQLPGDNQRRDVICLALRKLNGWLQTISPNKVRPEIRDRVIQYQEECDDVLYEYWATGEVRPRDNTNATYIIAPINQDGEWLVKVHCGQIVTSEFIGNGRHVLSINEFEELSRRAGNIIVSFEALRKMTALEIIKLTNDAEANHAHWMRIFGKPKIECGL